ncbi:hypothetical protein TUM17576_47000 [Enterobacter hormaechei]|nr:hypothetical protein [Enterobacter hormaechei]GJL37880.1 hypothetical protein TUM17576_47000 [Enterobacter hormaechei]
MKEEMLLQSREHFISLCNKFWNWQELDEITAGEEEPRLEWDGQEFTHRVTQALWRMYQAAIQSGNSAQPEPVNQTYKLPPNSFTDDYLDSMAHGDNPVANAYRELLEFRRNAAGGNSAQPVTVPDECINAAYEKHLYGIMSGTGNKRAAVDFLNECLASMRIKP